MKAMVGSIVVATLLSSMLLLAVGCASISASPATNVVRVDTSSLPSGSGGQVGQSSSSGVPKDASAQSSSADSSADSSDASEEDLAAKLRKKLDIDKDFRKSFIHGDKPVKYQKYIVLHDTEGEGEPEDIVGYWDNSEAGVAAHFVIGKDGHIVQCVPLDKIAHHAGYGDTGHNKKFGVEDESRDDKEGAESIGDWASDYGMNSYSVGIEMIHVGGQGDYPKAQLKALDGLIAYIDAYFGKESKIIDHKAWRSGNSDTSEEFSEYLENLQDHRTHN